MNGKFHVMKKIIIFTCHCGGGHTAANDALQHYLTDYYEVHSICIFCQVLQQIDLVKKFTFNCYTLEDFYNFLAKKKWNQFLNLLLRMKYYFLAIKYKKIDHIIFTYLKTHQPHLVISIIPFFNNHILYSAKKLNIPFILFPTDLNPSIFIRNIKKIDYKKFSIAISFNDDAILNLFKEHNIPPQYITTIGFPLKPAFLRPKNKNLLKNRFDIPKNKPVILLLMGSQGASSLYNFTKQLITINIPFHLIIVRGKNNLVQKKLNKILFPPHISVTSLGFTKQIPDLLAITDLLITKSGGASVCEALYMNVPLLLDATSTILQWEQFNQDFIVNNNFGEIVKHYHDLPNLVKKYLSNKELLEMIKGNIQSFKKKNGGIEAKKLIEQLLNS